MGNVLTTGLVVVDVWRGRSRPSRIGESTSLPIRFSHSVHDFWEIYILDFNLYTQLFSFFNCPHYFSGVEQYLGRNATSVIQIPPGSSLSMIV